MTGSQWNQLPERYGKWNSVYRFHFRWSKKGVFSELLQIYVGRVGLDGRKVIDATHIKVHQDACHFHESPENQGFGKTKGGRNSKLSAVTNGKGKALAFDLMPGNQADITAALRVLGNVTGQVVLGDKGYDCNALRSAIFYGGGGPNIPGRQNRKTEVPYFDSIGKGRYVVECFFQRIKRFRRINTRYDRLAATYLSFVNLSALADWTR
ncbi:MAG: IS5 family transposase [Akkermansiaceae bacterium]